MKRWLIPSVLAIGLAAPHAAKAQWVVSCPECDKEWTQLISWIKSLVNEEQSIQNQLTQITTAHNQLTEAVNTVQAITNVRDVGTALYAMNMLGIQNPLPELNLYAIQSLVRGDTVNLQGSMANLGSVFNTYAANRIYAPPGTDWYSQQTNSNAATLAGYQTLAQGSLTSAQARLTQDQGLRTRLAAATTLKDVTDVHAQIAAAQSDAQAQQLQLANVQTLATIQPALNEQRRHEFDMLSICQHIAYLRGNEDGIATAPNCTASGGGAGGTSGSLLLTGYVGTGIGGTSGGGGSALGTMMATNWGEAAADNATALGVNPEALAATCVIESGCRNVAGSGSVSGPFQMTDATYASDMAKAVAANPDLSSSGGKGDPATQSIAAAQDLRTAAIGLQAAGIPNPTVLDARGAYNFGTIYGVPLATASDQQTMESILLPSYSPAQLSANGVTPGMTVGQWRAGIVSKLGASASAPILASAT